MTRLSNPPIWACPKCSAALQLNSSAWQCSAGHSFDRAREGYVNLLPVHHKRSKMPGDSPEMVTARRVIHNAQLYGPLATQIAEVVASASAASVLDVGCGEGYYDGVIVNQSPALSLYGVDIAKPAVRVAARSYPALAFAVASSYRLPVIDDAVDITIRVFAPSSDAEVRRVTRSEGYYLEVGPAPRHLWQLRTALYDRPIEHELARCRLADAELHSEGNCEYSAELDQTLLTALVAATPFAFRGHREKRAALLKRDGLEVGMSFVWRLFKWH